MLPARLPRTLLLAILCAALATASRLGAGVDEASVGAGGGPSAGQATPHARADRVEKGLLPGILVAGRPRTPAALADRMAALSTPGVSVAVINDGVIEWARGYGVVEAGSATPVTPSTLFQAASISKSVAALAAMRLVEQGKLGLDEDVNARLSSWKVPGNSFTQTEKVTLRRLLSHTAGLTVHGFGGYPADAAVPTLVEVLDGLKPANSAAVRADAIPGSLWRYSGGGYTVMQLLAAEVTGRPFPVLMSELALKPIGMADSTYEQPLPAARRGQAASAHRSDGKPIPGRFHTYPEMAAAGLWTTPTDLARFLVEIQRALAGRSSVLSAASARQMTTVVKDGYGLGLSVQGLGQAASFGHGGSNAGFRCTMTAFAERGQGAVVMTNGDQGSRLAAEIVRAIAVEYGWPSHQPNVRSPVAVDPAALARLAGRYEMRPGRIVAVTLERGTLFIVDGQQRIELFPESPTRFFEVVEETTVEFVSGSDGRVTHLTIDGRIKAPRIEGM